MHVTLGFSWLQAESCINDHMGMVHALVRKDQGMGNVVDVTSSKRLILRNGDVIVSEKYLELITSVISIRTGSTPRYNRPRVIDRVDVPMLRPEGLCTVCMDRPLQTIFNQCGHISLCLPCFNEAERKAAEQSKAVRCPICRGGGNIRRVYFP